MIVPQFWVEAKGEARVKAKRITIKRFGWSDISLDDAHQKAEERLVDAIKAIEAGEGRKRVDPKTAYNGADGMPIREEIISRHDDVIITRNGYGARCLNTPDVLFADIDFVEPSPHQSASINQFFMLLLCATFVAAVTVSWVPVIIFMIVYFLLITLMGKRRKKVPEHVKEELSAQERIRHFVQQHPDWHLRVYRTPLGLRVLVMHRLFDPQDSAVKDFFTALHVDPLYQTMCSNQRCFRARVSPKPWRIEVWEHIAPARGLWPVNENDRLLRAEWVQAYETRAQDYAACRFVESLGSNRADIKALRVQQLHDDLSRANLELPIA